MAHLAVISKLKQNLRGRGYGLLHLVKEFHEADRGGDGCINWEDFERCLSKCALNPNPQEMRVLFQYLDSDSNNEIVIDEFLSLMLEELTPLKEMLIKFVFSKLDTDGDGIVKITDIGACVNFLNHPDVVEGRITAMNLMTDFFESLNVISDKGYLTLREFTEYYARLCAFDDDDAFSRLLCAIWCVEPEQLRLARSAGTGKGKGAGAGTGTRAGVEAGGSSSSSGSGSSLSSFLSQKGASTGAGSSSSSSSANAAGAQSKAETGTVALTEQSSLDKLRAQLKARGANGIIGLQRKFKIIDDDDSHSINMLEFRKTLREMALVLTDAESSQLFTFFDKDHSGCINFDEFLFGVRGPIPARREALVRLAFETLDGDRSGVLDPADIMKSFDASKHPDVVAGRRTTDAILREFLDTFDVGGTVDGKVTREEFVNYYTNISASIDSDDYFELMIRNAWHISGGTGQAANSANRRVLVTHADGSQTVEEIKSDLGLKSDDKAGMMARLRAQGMADISGVATTYGSKGKPPAKGQPAAAGARAGAGAGAATTKEAGLSLLNNAKLQRSETSMATLTAAMSAVSVENQVIADAGPTFAVPVAQPKAAKSFAAAEAEAEARTFFGGGSRAHAGAISLAAAAESVKPLEQGTTSFGLAYLLKRLKAELKARGGGTGFIGLQRKFRIMDDDNSKSLDRNEFKKALTEMDMNLDKDDFLVLFRHFDSDNSGTIGFEEFIQGVRDPLNARRRALVDMAFDRLDTDGNGVIDGEEIANIYDASKHPEVIAGRKTPADVLTAFLSTFDVGGTVDGKVTREEFANYYANIGANIDSDDYFELMIRNAWHISGGEGQAANSANRRVLVTHADGSQTVEEIKNDLGLKAGDTVGMMARLRAQGLADVSSIAKFGSFEEKEKASGGSKSQPLSLEKAAALRASQSQGQGKSTTLGDFARKEATAKTAVQQQQQQRPPLFAKKAGAVGASAAAPAAAGSGGSGAGGSSVSSLLGAVGGTVGALKADPLRAKLALALQSSDDQAATLRGGVASKQDVEQVARSGPRMADAGIKSPSRLYQRPSTAPAGGGSSGSGGVGAGAGAARVAHAGIALIIDKLKKAIKSRGAHGFIGLQRKFRLMDDDNSGTIDLSEFKKAMREMNISLTDSELRLLFTYFDTDHSNMIGFDEFVAGLREPLNTKRYELVQVAFTKIDLNGDGVVSGEEIAGLYDASRHPDVIAGRRSPTEVMTEFLATFDVGGTVDGKVTREEFVNYYTNISASIDSDDYFELMIRNAWHIGGGTGQAANSANRRVLVTHADGSQTVEEIKSDLGLKSDDKAGMIAALEKEGLEVVNLSTLGEAGDSNVSAAGSARRRDALLRKKVFTTGQGTAEYGTLPGGIMLHGNKAKVVEKSAKPPLRSKPIKPDLGVCGIVNHLKSELCSRGARGFIGLQRKFRIMDDDSNNSLSLSEFKKALIEMNMGLCDRDMRVLFEYFDSDNSGSISFEEFVQGVRNPLSERRLDLIYLAFARMDATGDGVVTAEDLVNVYDASKHPEVIAERMSPAEALREFLDTFDVGGTVDGKVTREEFVNYYTNIGASIDSDDYFELMIRNAWHISGGTGQAANSANRRVLLTHADGSQTVEEIKSDLGLKADNKTAMMAYFKSHGMDVQSISNYGSLDDTHHGRQQLLKPRDRRIQAAAPKEDVTAGAKSLTSKPVTAKTKRHQSTMMREAMNQNVPPKNMTAASRLKRMEEASPGLSLILQTLRTNLQKHGAHGFIGLARKFRLMDDNENKSLDLAEFKKGMQELNMGLTDVDLRLLFKFFDADDSGMVTLDEFVCGVRPPLAPVRQALIDQAFDILDLDKNGWVDGDEIATLYDASKHPDVIAGKRTPAQIYREFLDTFDVGGTVDGKVTREEFTNYYTNISASIDGDDYFELMIRNAWHISGGTGQAANSANRRVLMTLDDGSQAVEEIKSDLGLKANDTTSMMQRLRSQGRGNLSSIDLFGGGEDNAKDMRFQQPSSRRFNKNMPQDAGIFQSPTKPDAAAAAAAAAGVSGIRSGSAGAGGNVGGPRSGGRMQGSSLGASRNRSSLILGVPSASGLTSAPQPQSAADKIASMSLGATIGAFKANLARRGARGFIGLQRRFRIADDNSNGQLSFTEFKKCLAETDIHVSEEEVIALFNAFDRDHSGDVDFEEFLAGLRGPMSNRRLEIISLAFSKLDIDGDGVVDAQEIATLYDASKHPDVIAGKRTPAQIYREFLDTFDVGGTVDGKVTREEFANYYTNISASIDSDDYFELMIRNAWHISGGTGQAANSANRRVLVTLDDGSQAVEEIKNDLGLKAGDKAGMIQRLRSQGRGNLSTIDLFGAGEDNDKDKDQNLQSQYSSRVRTGKAQSKFKPKDTGIF